MGKAEGGLVASPGPDESELRGGGRTALIARPTAGGVDIPPHSGCGRPWELQHHDIQVRYCMELLVPWQPIADVGLGERCSQTARSIIQQPVLRSPHHDLLLRVDAQLDLNSVDGISDGDHLDFPCIRNRNV